MAEIQLIPGDILVEKKNGWFGDLITFVLWPFFKDPKYQHARVIYTDTEKVIEDGEIISLDGTKNFCVGINFAPKNLELYEVWRPKCSEEIKLKAIKLMETRLGEPYGFLSLFGIYLRKFIGIKIPDLPGQYCIEIISWAYREAGYDLHLGLEDFDTAPWEIRNPDRLEHIF